MSFDTTNLQFVFESIVKDGAYLAIGFGDSMTDTEMLQWSANGEGSFFQPLFSTGHKKPDVDVALKVCYTVEIDSQSIEGYVKFTTRRSFDCLLEGTYIFEF